jgi:F-type H+-transporting ATPase subunit alpha
MSITDGQIIFDLNIFRRGIRPAVNAGLSVSRVGGQAQTNRQKRLSSTLFKALARYRQAEEFSHFGSSLSKEASVDLTLGKQLYDALQQPPEERHDLVEQQLILETILLGEGTAEIDIPALKESAKQASPKVKDEKDFDRIEAELFKKHGRKPQVLDTKPAGDETGPAAGQTEEKPDDKPDKEEKA